MHRQNHKSVLVAMSRCPPSSMPSMHRSAHSANVTQSASGPPLALLQAGSFMRTQLTCAAPRPIMVLGPRVRALWLPPSAPPAPPGAPPDGGEVGAVLAGQHSVLRAARQHHRLRGRGSPALTVQSTTTTRLSDRPCQ